MKTLTLLIILLLTSCVATIQPGSYSPEQKYVDILFPGGTRVRLEIDTIATGDEIIKFYHPIHIKGMNKFVNLKAKNKPCANHKPMSNILDYRAWHQWAARKTKQGHRQKQCPDCGRWLFICEW